MMRALIAGLVLVLLLSTALASVKATPPGALPPRPEQPHADLFSCGAQTCDVFNPITQKARATRQISYRLLVMPGCAAGTIYDARVHREKKGNNILDSVCDPAA